MPADPPPALTPDDLRRWGPLLYGQRWQSDLSEGLELRDSSRLREMLSGRRPIGPSVRDKIRAIAEARMAELAQLLAELR